MRKGFWLLGATVVSLGFAACDGATEWGAGSPPAGGGQTGGPMGGGIPDAAPVLDSGADPNLITGQVCRVDNITLPGACAPLPTAGLDVVLEKTTGEPIGDPTTTDSSGKFRVPRPALVDRVVIRVSDSLDAFHGAAKIVVLAGQGAVDTQIPLITESYYNNIITTSLVMPTAGTGMVVTHLRKTDSGYAGVTLGPIQGQQPYYDTGDPALFSQVGPTSSRGIGVWFDITRTPSTTYLLTHDMDDLRVERDAYAYPDAITFLEEQF
jgi:hypothetical protein